MKFLIIRFSSIGDIVLTSPVIRCLRKKFPDAAIHYAVKKSFHPIIRSNPYITKIHLLKDSTAELINELKAEKFDYIIDLHHNQRTLLIKLRLGVKSFSFNKLNWEKWLMVNFKINKLPPVHIVDRYLDTCKSFAAENDGEGLDYFLASDDEVELKSLPAEFQSGYLGWVIGAKQNTKKFPVSKIIEAVDQLQMPVMLLGGKEDRDAAEEICRTSKNKNLYNACGGYSINQSASLVKQSQVIVSNDTGLMHIATAFKKPVISVWGNTIPAFGMAPYYSKNEIANYKMEVNGLPCRPCSKLGFDKCPEHHFNCMNRIDVSEIIKVIQNIIGN